MPNITGLSDLKSSRTKRLGRPRKTHAFGESSLEKRVLKMFCHSFKGDLCRRCHTCKVRTKWKCVACYVQCAMCCMLCSNVPK